MHRSLSTILIALLIASAASRANSAGEIEIRTDEPISGTVQIEGALRLDWLIVPYDASLGMNLSFTSKSLATELVELGSELHAPPLVYQRPSSGEVGPTSWHELPPSTTLTNDRAGKIGTMQAIGVEDLWISGEIQYTIQWLPAGTCQSSVIGEGAATGSLSNTQIFCTSAPSLAMKMAPTEETTIHFETKSLVEFSEDRLTCLDAACEFNGRREGVPPQSAPGGSPIVGGSIHRFYQFERSPGLVEVESPLFIIGIASELDMLFDGVIRFPVAAMEGECWEETCLVEDQTVLVSGTGLLQMRPNTEGSIKSAVEADLNSIRIDERTITESLAAPAAAAGLLTLGLFLKVLLGLMTHHAAKGNPLEHPRRELLFGYIKENPGATFREVVRGTEVPTGTARHHLSVLRRADIIVSHRHHETLRFFENHGRFEQSWHSVVVLRDPEMARLHAWLGKHPGSFQKEILAAMDEHGWSRSTTQNRLKRLQAEGLVSMRPQGRLKCYSVVDAPSRLGDVAT